MSAEKLSPRQQMISMMYLVLLAMLAMNASKDLLNAFIKLEEGIEVTNDSFDAKNKSLYDEIKQAKATGSSDAIAVYNKSRKIQESADSLFSLLESYKVWLIDAGDGLDDDSIPLGKDDADIGAEFFLTMGNGEILREKINHYEVLLASYIEDDYPEITQQIHTLLSTPEFKDPDGNMMTWEAGISEYLPMAAVTANLTNIQSYVRNAETEVVSYLYNKIKDDLFKFDKLEGMVMAPKAYIMQNDSFNANVFLGAFNTEVSPIIYVGEYDTALFNSTGEIKWEDGFDSIPVINGIGKFSTLSSQVGNTSWRGIIKVPHPNPKKRGVYMYYPYEHEYVVAKPSGTASLTGMNIVYNGYPNPLEIAVAGYPNNKIRARFTKGRLDKKSDGKYDIIANSLGRAKIYVEAEDDNGNWQNMQTMDVIVKPFPKAVAEWTTSRGNPKVLKSHFEAGSLAVKYPPDFVFTAAKAKLHSYKMTVQNSNGLNPPINSSDNDKLSRTLKNLRKGNTVMIEDIKIKNPDNSISKANDITYIIR